MVLFVFKQVKVLDKKHKIQKIKCKLSNYSHFLPFYRYF